MKKMTGKIAQLISTVFGPWLEIPVMLVAAVLAAYRDGAPGLMLVFLLFIDILIPYVAFLLLLRHKDIKDWDITNRKERLGIVTFATVCHLGGVGLAWLFGQTDLAKILMAFWILAVIFTLITYFWKISFHVGVNSALALFLFLILGGVAILFFAVPIIVAWSRLKLKRHGVAQVMIGGLMGILGMLAGMRLVGI